MEKLKFTYIFSKDGREKKHFNLLLDSNTLNLIQDPPSLLPKWTKLTTYQCRNCPLSEKETEY
ncbi:MAG: hypothetical protein SVM86_00430 [Candidatus Cloacimonadota bacterium]|nr:hypothetical protein [Candidatus Cloacimonadota bacterium]